MNYTRLIECVPNFSEGRDLSVIKEITDEISSVEGVKLLDVDPGKATNRTVVTFVGNPDAVVQAAYLAICKAGELIDMSKHKGEHPRMGATDVCPLIPISGITMEETVHYAKKLGAMVGNNTEIPVYLYEEAATSAERKNLANIRAGEYEGLINKLKDPQWKPDFGKAVFNNKSGATVIGARDFLVAYNVNLNTTSVRRANSVAFDVRENGRIKTDPVTGKNMMGEKGEVLRVPGMCKSVKAIGWYIDEYGIAQISMNLTNIAETPLHIAFDACCQSASSRGMRVTGSELVGLVPKKVLLDAGKHFLQKQGRSVGVSEKDLIHIAVKSLGLDELGPFDPKKKIIEFLLEENHTKKLVDLNLTDFANETASESPAPGGGSISAYVGSLGVGLGTMVANLSAHKKGWEDKIEYFSSWAEKGQELKDKLLKLVDEDTLAFNKIMDAFKLPKDSEEEKVNRKNAIHDATKEAIEIPLMVMRTSLEAMTLLKEMAEKGNPNSVSDAGVGALCCKTAVHGALLNVQINCNGFQDVLFVTNALNEANQIYLTALDVEKEIVSLVLKVMDK
jgi:glutamate formiminotransferase/formiminotetrahydrofolate cyclodeaminase